MGVEGEGWRKLAGRRERSATERRSEMRRSSRLVSDLRVSVRNGSDGGRKRGEGLPSSTAATIFSLR